MKETRHLSLKRETLAALDSTELEAIVGAHAITTNCGTNDTYSALCRWTFNTCEC